MGRKKSKPVKSISVMNPNAAGIDIGSAEHYVSVPQDRDEQSVQSFKCYTPDIYAMATWLKDCGITTVAMESTGVYWIPVYQILEQKGFEVLLVNARHIKNVPGRKTDVQDCQWIQELHTFGLLRGSFRPSDDICVLRSFIRQRTRLLQNSSQHILRMQKALTEMNLHLHKAISNIMGVAGKQIIEAIINGEHNPEELAKFRNKRLKCSYQELKDALTGDYRPEQLFILHQEYEQYKFIHQQLTECDNKIEECYQMLCDKYSCTDTPTQKPKKPTSYKNTPDFNLHSYLAKLAGVDLTTLPGLNTLSVQEAIAESGLDMTRWVNDKCFASWLGLSPANKITGGKVFSTRTRKITNRLATVFRIAANAVSHSNTGLGAYCRRLKARLGAPKAITATARKIAVQYYNMLKYKSEYKDKGAEEYEQKYNARVLQNIKKRAESLGYQLVETKQEPGVVS